MCLLVLTPFSQAQEFPNRPVTIVVPYPAGGAGGTIGAARVAKARPNTERPYTLKKNLFGGGPKRPPREPDTQHGWARGQTASAQCTDDRPGL